VYEWVSRDGGVNTISNRVRLKKKSAVAVISMVDRFLKVTLTSFGSRVEEEDGLVDS